MNKDYVNENSIRFELTMVNLSELWKKEELEDYKVRFNNRKLERIEELKKEINSSKEKDKYILEKELERVENLSIESMKKERIGNMIYLIANNLSKKSCFYFYTNNWKDELISESISHTLKYMKNYDENKVSERSGQKIKAFAYITQIVYTSFLGSIKKLKKDQETIKKYYEVEDKIRRSSFNNEFILRYKILDYKTLNEDLELLDNFIKLKKELMILEIERNELQFYKGEKDEYWLKTDSENRENLVMVKNKMNKLGNLSKEKYLPKILEIHYTENNGVDLSSILKRIQDLEIECYFIKEEVEKDSRFKKVVLDDFDW